MADMSPPTLKVALPKYNRINSDFSSNVYGAKSGGCHNFTRHPDIYFEDGNVAILTGSHYSLVHQGLLSRHSNVLKSLLETVSVQNDKSIEGCPMLQLQDSPDDMAHFLKALYDGISHLTYDGSTFEMVAGLLRLFTKYQVHHLRQDVLRGLSSSWPKSLAKWDTREAKATDSSGLYAPRHDLPHPILVIELAHEVGAIELLPSASYDLSRFPPSQAAAGFQASSTSAIHRLGEYDLLNVLRGREHGSRFLSTFIVNELEGRDPSNWCIHRKEEKLSQRRACQIAFEAVTYELLRDVNGVVCNRNSDPLYAIQDAELMQTREDIPGAENKTVRRACEACRAEFGAVVDAAREEFWGKLPQWFGVDLENWG